MADGKLASAGEGGEVRSSPLKGRGGGVWERGSSHRLDDNFSKKKVGYDTELKMIRASWGSF